ncbi:MAG: HNH endonuclease [Aggregatilineales bacterium]
MAEFTPDASVQDDSFYTHEIDHIIPEKHRRQTELDNLCPVCMDCNRYKGSDFASFDPETDQITSLFNPRLHAWEDHFSLQDGQIIPLTPEGRVTVFVLRLNSEIRIRARKALIKGRRYPSE